MILGGIFDLELKYSRFDELTVIFNDPKLWEDPKKAQELNKERVHLEKELKSYQDGKPWRENKAKEREDKPMIDRSKLKTI